MQKKNKNELKLIKVKIKMIGAGKPCGCSSIYDEKIVKNHFWEDMTILRGRG